MTVAAFLAAHGWGGAVSVPLAGDASARRYHRLLRGGARAVLMQAPPDDRTSFDAFLSVAARLHALGLSAPRVLASDADRGLMLLEDLGDLRFADLGADLPGATDAAVDVLIHLARHPEGWGLLTLTPDRLAAMTRVALPDSPLTDAALRLMEAQFTAHFTHAPVPALRDVHSENLIWLPDRAGLARVGLLDFQDAVMAPPGYDLVSYIHDARRDVPDDIATRATDRYATALALNPESFSVHCALLSLQRNLRILGVFRRLARERGKPGYLTFLPRVFAHVDRALAHPALAELDRAMRPLMRGLAP
ncbi:aminoglycoside phosphotransferase family protein [Nioella nitratireducens]|uniref:aminoglycoside phosphotransferase family protein n=1 Tax=Nioella nitratireducens TaxID=1287720 RepID=UPI0008FCEB17|nr:phosphotransferase [Nioella nitratireducens]